MNQNKKTPWLTPNSSVNIQRMIDAWTVIKQMNQVMRLETIYDLIRVFELFMEAIVIRNEDSVQTNCDSFVIVDQLRHIQDDLESFCIFGEPLSDETLLDKFQGWAKFVKDSPWLHSHPLTRNTDEIYQKMLKKIKKMS